METLLTERLEATRVEPQRATVWRLLAAVGLLLVFGAGLYGRFAGFGERPLAVDEFYFLKSAEQILAQGVPRFADGGYYVHGLLPQYLTAASLLVVEPAEAAVRLPAALFGLLAVALSFVYARRHLGVVMALGVAAAVMVSSWEIEFSRFGRMYTALQCATLGFLFALDRVGDRGSRWRRYGPHVWLGVAMLCHLLAAILAPLLFVPLVDARNREMFATRRSIWDYAVVSIAAAAGAVGFALSDFRRWGVVEPFPAGYAKPVSQVFQVPHFAFWLPEGPPELLLFGVLAVVAVVGIVGVVLVWRGRLEIADVGLALVLAASLMHQFALAALVGFVLLARYGVWELLRPLYRRAMVAVAAVAGVIWTAWGFADLGSWIAASGSERWTGAVHATFFGWPEWRYTILEPWARDLPVLGVLAIAAAFGLLLVRTTRSWVDLVSGPAFFVLYGVVVFGVLRYYFVTTRYTYLFHAVALTAIALVACNLVGSRRAWIPFAVAVFAMTDYSPHYLMEVDSAAVANRMGRYEGRDGLWYARTDFRAIAEHLRANDEVRGGATVVVQNCPPVAQYLDAPGYVSYLDRSTPVFYEWSRERGTEDVWLGRPLVSTHEELRARTIEDRAAWIVRRRNYGPAVDPARAWRDRLRSVRTKFVSADGSVEVLRVELDDGRED